MTESDVLPIYIGWDSREQEAYDVCRHSIIDRTSASTYIRPLKHRLLRSEGLFTRPWKVDEKGQYWDERDGRPFSTEFSHSRFLTPYLAKRDVPSAKWALFVDCDFLFLADIQELFALADEKFAVMCVKHRHTPTESVKMDGVAQTSYHRKNWSSLVLFNLHLSFLNPNVVNEAPGSELHGFNWVDDLQLGELPPEWNVIQGVSPDVEPKAVHYSEKAPWFIQHGDLWERERFRMRNPRPTLWERLKPE